MTITNPTIPRGSRKRGRSLDDLDGGLQAGDLPAATATRFSDLTQIAPFNSKRLAVAAIAASVPVAERATADIPMSVRKMTSELMEAQRRFDAQVRVLLEALIDLDGRELHVEEIFEICGKLGTTIAALQDGAGTSDKVAIFARHLKRNMSHLNRKQLVALRVGLTFVDTPSTQIECPYLTAIQAAVSKRLRVAQPAGKRARSAPVHTPARVAAAVSLGTVATVMPASAKAAVKRK